MNTRPDLNPISVPKETSRLSFRTWTEANLPLAQSLWGDPAVTQRIGGPFSDAQVQARLAQEIANQREYGMQYWPVFARGTKYTHDRLNTSPSPWPSPTRGEGRNLSEEDKTPHKPDGTSLFIGCCGVRPYDLDAGILELGFHLCRHAWGRGYATEAARTVIAFAFEELGASALFAGHHPENAGSKRVLEKLGFTFVRAELYPPTGLMHPSYMLYP